MLLKLRQRMAREESGFTLVELLVVMLILGLLIAVAIPTFFNQKQKANDADSKAMAHTAQTAMETYATDHSGSYLNANVTALTAIEGTIDGTVTLPSAPTATDYQIRVTNPTTGHWFEIDRTGGTFAFPCNPGGQGGCPDDATPGGQGDWGG